MKYEVIHLKEHFAFLGEDGKDPVLELFLPYNMTEMHRENQKRPCMFVCPGGGYGMVSQRESEPIGVHFLPEGYNVFVLTYTCAPSRFPTQLREVAAAMELIHRNADAWNCDVSRIAIMGFSAGGHLAAHYSTAYDCTGVREVFPDSKPVQASVLCYPVITADARYANRGTYVNLLGHFPETQAEIDAFSCEKLVSDHTPPAFLWHTAEDSVVPVMNTYLYAAALAEHHIPCEVHVYPYGPHGLATVDDQTCGTLPEKEAYAAAWLDAVKKWLKLIF